MVSPERLNVLLSRARNALIIIGNPATFLASRKGGELWGSFFDLLAETDSIYEGLPVKCQQHPDREMILSTPEDFDKYCPDGGCSAPWYVNEMQIVKPFEIFVLISLVLSGVKLPCNVHECTQKCHRRADHTKVKCAAKVQDRCPKGHVHTRRCSDGPPASCRTCDKEARAAAARQERDFNLEVERRAKQSAYAQELAQLQDEIDYHSKLARNRREVETQENELRQRQQDVENARTRAAKVKAAERMAKAKKASAVPSQTAGPSPGALDSKHDASTPTLASDARDDWQRQKQVEGAKNQPLDTLMDMIGLEDVKDQFLEIKSKIDLLVRQDLDIGKERFGASLLGNPGTGNVSTFYLLSELIIVNRQDHCRQTIC